MTQEEFYNYITQHMTADEALKKLLAAPLLQFQELKALKAGNINEEEFVNPIFIIAAACADIGWHIVVETDQPTVRGLFIGTDEYIEKYHPKKNATTT